MTSPITGRSAANPSAGPIRADNVRAMSIGTRAAGRLHQHGRVHSVFGRVCNLVTRDDLLVSLVAPVVGNGPANVILDVPDDIDFRAQGLREGQVVRQVGRTLHVGHVAVALDAAASWQPALFNLDTPPEILRTSLALAKSYAGPVPAGDAAILSESVEARVADFDEAASRLDQHGRAEAARGLVGLGPGLTPAGDDFLAGYAAGLSHLAAGWATDERQVLASTLDLTATSWLSGQKLVLALTGEMDERLADAARAILSGDPRMSTAVSRLGSMGHTSGWYAIAGICTAARLALAHASRRSASATPVEVIRAD